MNRLILIVVFIFLFKFNSSFSQNKTFFKNTVEYLSSEQLAGRQIGTEGIVLSKSFIIDEYKKIGLKPFVQEFQINDSIPAYKGIKCENIIGIIDNKSDSTIIFSAHYDHIGTDTLLSKEVVASKRKKIHNGANDNASGVAMILALAKYFSGCKKKASCNYVFVNCSAHEVGLIGSNVFFNSSFFKGLNVKAIINVDMIGKLNPTSKYLKIGGVEKNGSIKEFFLNEDIKSDNLNFLFNEDQLLMSDATIFYKNGISAYTFTTGTSEDYHRSTDDAEKINYNGMESIFTLLKKFIITIYK